MEENLSEKLEHTETKSDYEILKAIVRCSYILMKIKTLQIFLSI